MAANQSGVWYRGNEPDLGHLDHCDKVAPVSSPVTGELPPEPIRELHRLHQGPAPKAHKLELYTGSVAQWQHVARAAARKIPDIDREDVCQDVLVRFLEYPPRTWAGCWALAHSVIARYWAAQHPNSARSLDELCIEGEDGSMLTLGDVTPAPYDYIRASEERQILRGLPREIVAAAKLARQPLRRSAVPVTITDKWGHRSVQRIPAMSPAERQARYDAAATLHRYAVQELLFMSS